MDWKKTATKDGFVKYNFERGERILLEEKSLRLEKRTSGKSGSLPAVTLAAISVVYRSDRKLVDSEFIRRDYDKYLGLPANA